MKGKFQNAVASRIIEVERTVWFQCKVSASTSFSESFSCLAKPTRLSLEAKHEQTSHFFSSNSTVSH